MKKIGIIGYHGVGHLKVINIANDLVQKTMIFQFMHFHLKKIKKKRKK